MKLAVPFADAIVRILTSASKPALIAAAQAVQSAAEGEIALLEGQIAELGDRDPVPGETETVIATRRGAVLAPNAERSRWRKIVGRRFGNAER
ncbi:hypothetical protein [Nocardia sp. SSK8]|uniref:hypothetical protein n=1 Tax=Nocardia sp. SSK8 TaxID=3120154 RepID=UPI00300A52F4